jgi:hypothetical protein
VLRGATFDPRALRRLATSVEHAAEPLHHRWRVGDAKELRPVLVAPVAQHQALGFEPELTH